MSHRTGWQNYPHSDVWQDMVSDALFSIQWCRASYRTFLRIHHRTVAPMPHKHPSPRQVLAMYVLPHR